MISTLQELYHELATNKAFNTTIDVLTKINAVFTIDKIDYEVTYDATNKKVSVRVDDGCESCLVIADDLDHAARIIESFVQHAKQMSFEEFVEKAADKGCLNKISRTFFDAKWIDDYIASIDAYEEKYLIGTLPRQSGKSEMVALTAAYCASVYPKSKIFIKTFNAYAAKDIAQKIHEICVKMAINVNYDLNSRFISFGNGSIVECCSCCDTIRGEKADAIIFDEYQYDEDFDPSIVANARNVIALSSVKNDSYFLAEKVTDIAKLAMAIKAKEPNARIRMLTGC